MTFSDNRQGQGMGEPLRIPPPQRIPPAPTVPPPISASPPAAANGLPALRLVSDNDPASTTRRRERELAELEEEVAALQELLEERPSIFERTFRGRMEGLTRQQAQLQANNRALRQRLKAIAPGAEIDPPPARPRRLLPAAVVRPGIDRLSDGAPTRDG
ncbi:MAG: hypothetical protein ACKOCA_06010 [Vulcanococcus sp.]